MDQLLPGYARFRATEWPAQREVFRQLAERGQHPAAMVIACCDSRCDPAMIFDAAPGELFVLRNVANLVPPFAPDGAYHGTAAALEFAVCVLQVPTLVVMGHAMCGGIGALMRGVPESCPDFIGPWISIAERARSRALQCDAPDPVRACEYEVVRLSLENLRTFPWIAARVAQGRLALRGAFFDIRSGLLETLGEDGVFRAAVG